jgi:RF-1 domain
MNSNTAKRNEWLKSDDDKMICNCRFEPFKASGTGGQKRNKTSSAVRLTHLPTAIVVTDCSGRSQHKNRHSAIKKLRMQLALELRCKPVVPEQLDISLKNPAYAVFVAQIIDIFYSFDYELKKTAEFICISSSKLVKIIQRDPQLWQYINQCRQAKELPLLKKNR